MLAPVNHPCPPPLRRAAPFTEYAGDDVIRLIIVLLLTYLIAVAAKIAYVRLRRGVEWPPEESPWALLSYVMLACAATVQSTYRFGMPMEWVRTVPTMAALLFGAVAAYRQVTFEGWRWRFHRRRP